jgi:hypothetical protein
MAVGSVTWLDAQAWEEANTAHHREIGVQVADRWGVPRTVVTFTKDPVEYDAMNRNSPIGSRPPDVTLLPKRDGREFWPVRPAS